MDYITSDMLQISLTIGLIVARYVDSLISSKTIGGITFVKLGRIGVSYWVSQRKMGDK